MAELKKLMGKALVAAEDMNGEMSAEASEIVTGLIEKYAASENYEKAAQAIKEQLDKKLGPTWHCVVGEGFGFGITYNTNHMQYIFYGEKLGILIFKV